MKKLLFIIGVILMLAAGFLFYMGFFTSIKFKEQQMGEYILVYKSLTGDYKNSATAMDEIYHYLKDEYNIETTKGFGIYYDDPEKVAVEKLRSDAGCIIEPGDYKKMDDIKRIYQVKNFPQQKCLVAEFPYRNKLSIAFGVMKVYPTLEKEIKKNEYKVAPIMEMYEGQENKIFYIMPLSHN